MLPPDLAHASYRLASLEDPARLLQDLFLGSPFALQLYASDGHPLLVNQAFLNLFGSQPPPEYCVLEDDIARQAGMLEDIRRAFRGETVTLPPAWYDPRELTQVSVPEGNRVAIRTTFVPVVHAGAVRNVVVFFEDVTAAMLLRPVEDRDLLAAIVEQSGDGIIVCDAKGVVRVFNPAAQRQHGVGLHDAPASDWQKTWGLFEVDGSPLPLESTPLFRALHGEKVEGARWIVRRPDGVQRSLTGTATPLRNHDGTSAGAVVVTRDETERLAVETDRARFLAEAQSANRLKDEFLATVSHELRTPLHSMLGWARLLRSGSLDAAQTKRAAETIERNVEAQARLVEDLLDFSRIITGKLHLDVQPIVLADALRAAQDTLSTAADAKRIAMRTTIDPSLGAVHADPSRFHQILWNLLSNAVKFTPSGGRVDVAIDPDGEMVRITVADTGQGIERSFLPHVFEAFRQADSTTTRAHGGLGLGLSIVRQLVELHGGTVVAESAGPGMGSRFVVRIPARAGMPATTSIPLEAEPTTLDGVEVLVLDDEADGRGMVCAVLAGAGARPLEMTTAREALAAMSRARPGVVLCDLAMPEMDGFAFLREMRALPGAVAHTPVIALTAHTRPEDIDRVLTAGFDGHLGKPADPRQLTAAIASLLTAVRARRSPR